MSKAKPYERFGSFLLFKKLESDSFSELWRAGELDGDKLGNTVALRRFTGGDRAAMKAAAEHARAVVGAISGTTIARGQKVGIAGDVPYLVHEYGGGRTLKTILDRARGTAAAPANPIPMDQALAVVEKLASSCDTLTNVRYQGARLVHGALIPQFVWISEEGEVRAAGQQFGVGLLASLSKPDVAREIAPYFAPELRQKPEPSKASDVYALGALLFLMLTGKDLPEVNDGAALRQVLETTPLAQRQDLIPADIRPILEKSLHHDPASRFPSAGEMRTAVDKLLNGGEYSPTTFNLAFYLHSLLKKDMEIEANERPKEESLDVSPYLVVETAAPAPAPVAAAPAREPVAHAPFGAYAHHAEEEKKNRKPLIAAAIALIAVGAGAWVVLAPKPQSAAPAVSTASMVPAPAPKPAQPVAPPIDQIVASTPATATAAPLDEAARKKMFEDAVNKKLQEEMMKLQEDYNKQLQQKQVMQPSRPPVSAPAAATTPVQTTPARNEESVSAAQLDQQRRAQALPSTPDTTQSAAPAPAPSVAEAQPAPQPSAPTVREGDLVSVNDLDSIPELRSPVRPTYPPLAAQRHMETTVIISALIAENGRVIDTKILRGETQRVGFDDAALRAVRSAVFTPPMKDGKRVKTWKPLPIVFKLQ